MLGAPPDGQAACNQLDTPAGVDALLYSSQEALSALPLPDGVAMHLDGRHGVYVQAHFLNATRADLTATAEFTASLVDASKVKQTAGVICLVDGARIYSSDSWDSPVAREYAAPGLQLRGGQSVRWSCTYDNSTGAPINYGGSVTSNEMCIFGGIYYPAPDGAFEENTWACKDLMP